MSDEWFYFTTTILASAESRPSSVLKADGEPYYLEKRKQPIGFNLKPQQRERVLGGGSEKSD